MATKAHRKLMKELEKMRAALRDDPTIAIAAQPVNDTDIMVWHAVIEGPQGTEFEGGWFPLSITFPARYPHRPPTVKFTRPVYHPNVYANGNICLDILSEKWSPVYQVTTVLMSIRSLLDEPNIASPANCDASNDYKTDRAQYRRNIRKSMEKNGLTGAKPEWYVNMMAEARAGAAPSSSSSSSSSSAMQTDD